MGLGTKIRHIVAINKKDAEAQIEGLPFKVEIKAINYVGGKWYYDFTLLEKDSIVMDSYPSAEQKPPPAKRTKKTRTQKKKL
jgi:hypothetical protein